MAPPIYGLVLAGGRSSRMTRDKAALQIHGRTQLEWAVSLIGPFVAKAFVSVRPDQSRDPVRSKFETIVDIHDNLGPIAGIAAAQAKFPEAAWLVLACDLPYLDAQTVQTLLASRNPSKVATAFRSAHNGLPEPLCAVYEPSSREAIVAYIATGKDCPRKFLINSDVQLLDQPNPKSLENVNTPHDMGRALFHLQAQRRKASDAPRTRKNVKVQYYALLREQAGRSEEAVATEAVTPRELYDELKARYPFSLAPEMLRVAVNAEFGEWSQPLTDGDSVVFIPPVAGG